MRNAEWKTKVRVGIWVAIAACTYASGGCRNEGAPVQAVDSVVSASNEPQSSIERTSDFVARLVGAGWNSKAAESVVELNAEWFQIQAEENPTGLEIQLKLLNALGQYSDLHEFLIVHPETAGLLASVDNPRNVAESLSVAFADGEYERIAGLFVQHAAPKDAGQLALALAANYEQIKALHRRGFIGCEAIFIFSRDDSAGREYQLWLCEALSARSEASEEELGSFVNLAIRQGPSIRERMKKDEQFREQFRAELWPKLMQVLANDQSPLEFYLNEPNLWDLLMLENGVELLNRCGLLPLDLLYGYQEIGHRAYPKVLHDKIIQILLRREEQAIHSLMKFRDEPQFHKLLQRDLSPDTRSAALAQLLAAGTNYPAKLASYERLSNTALADEVGPPPSGIVTWVPFYYTLYEVPKKRLQGREPTGMDLLSAVADPAFLVVDIFTGGGAAAGRKALVAGGKEAAEAASKEIAEKGVEKFFVTTLRDSGLELAKKRVGKEISENMSEKELADWTITSMFSQVQQIVSSTAGKATTFEITKPVQFMFSYSGVGRDSWKRWTGLEAKLFMRGDARVFVRIGNLPLAILGSRGAAFLNRTSQDLSIGVIAESEPGQDALNEGVSKIVSAKDQLRAWQQNVSAWWLLNASELELELSQVEAKDNQSKGNKN
jgi:hypothetical protein